MGAKPTRMSRMFEGIQLKTIVFTRPILSAIFEAARKERAVSAPAIEKMYERAVSSTPNWVKNQNDTILYMTNPPANESTANKPDRRPTILLDLGDSICFNGCVATVVAFTFFDSMK